MFNIVTGQLISTIMKLAENLLKPVQDWPLTTDDGLPVWKVPDFNFVLISFNFNDNQFV
jgi:hypothetical protein